MPVMQVSVVAMMMPIIEGVAAAIGLDELDVELDVIFDAGSGVGVSAGVPVGVSSADTIGAA